MKYVLIVPDGMADLPIVDLDNRTPMEVARTPYLDDLARKGAVGVVDVTPPGMYPGSDAANMSLLGYDPLHEILPEGDGETQLRKLIWDSLELLDDLPFNKQRRNEGKLPANTLWPWGQGRAPQLPSFFRTRSVTGAVISAVDVIKGLGKLT